MKNSNEKPTVLVVEDQEEIRSMMARMLEKRGYHVIVSLDHGEAALVAEQEQPEPNSN